MAYEKNGPTKVKNEEKHIMKAIYAIDLNRASKIIFILPLMREIGVIPIGVLKMVWSMWLLIGDV